MTLPAFKAAGVGHETSVPFPVGHAAGDFAILFVESPDTAVTTPAGWNILSVTIDAVNSVRLYTFWKVAASGAEGNAAIVGSANHNWGVICTWTGVNTSNPIHSVTTFKNADGRAPGLTTQLDDCMIVAAYAWSSDTAGPVGASPTNADLGSVTERYDAGTLTGNGGGVYVADGTLAAKGAIGITSVTFTGAGFLSIAVIALQAADKTFSSKGNFINLGQTRMAIEVKQSTAQSFRFFMADAADGKTGKTGLTLAVTIQKEGDTSFSSIAPTVTEIGSGHYNVALTGTHMNTPGLVSLRSTATGADPADAPNCIDVTQRDKVDVVRQGMTSLPNAAAAAAGGLPTVGTGSGQVNPSAGRIGPNWGDVGNPTTVVGLSGTTVKTATDVATDVTTLLGRLTTLRAGYLDNLSAGAVALASTALSSATWTNLRAGYLDNLSAGAVALASALSTAQTAITAIKTKTDQFVFTVANQVDANALTGGGGATATDVRDAILNYEYRTGRTVRGLFRRIGAALEAATGLKGTLVSYFQPDGATVEFTVPQSVTNGTRSAATVTNSEVP